MRGCNVQTNEYDLLDKTCPMIYIYHKPHNNNENKFPVPGMYMQWVTQYDVTSISDTQPRKKYDINGKGGHFRFDNDNNLSYRYIISITYTEMGQLNIYNPIFCNENKR